MNSVQKFASSLVLFGILLSGCNIFKQKEAAIPKKEEVVVQEKDELEREKIEKEEEEGEEEKPIPVTKFSVDLPFTPAPSTKKGEDFEPTEYVLKTIEKSDNPSKTISEMGLGIASTFLSEDTSVLVVKIFMTNRTSEFRGQNYGEADLKQIARLVEIDGEEVLLAPETTKGGRQLSPLSSEEGIILFPIPSSLKTVKLILGDFGDPLVLELDFSTGSLYSPSQDVPNEAENEDEEETSYPEDFSGDIPGIPYIIEEEEGVLRIKESAEYQSYVSSYGEDRVTVRAVNLENPGEASFLPLVDSGFKDQPGCLIILEAPDNQGYAYQLNEEFDTVHRITLVEFQEGSKNVNAEVINDLYMRLE